MTRSRRFGDSETMSSTRSDITDDGNFNGGDSDDDGRGVTDQEEEKIVLKIKFQYHDDDVEYFQMKRNRLLHTLMKFYCELKNLDFNRTVFLCNGRRLHPLHTPDEDDMENGDEINALIVGSV